MAKRLKSVIATVTCFTAIGTSLCSAQSCSPPNVKPYDGPIFDAMAQTDQRLDGNAMVATAKSVGVVHMALFARVKLYHGSGSQNGRALVEALWRHYPGFFVLGAPKQFTMPEDLPSSYIDETLSGIVSGHYGFVGEILYTHGDKQAGEITPNGERYTNPTLPGTQQLLAGLKGRNVPLMTHWEAYDWSRDWPRFDWLYGTHPDQIFIWPHLGFGSLQQVDTVLRAHENVWATISKKDKQSEGLADEEKAEEVGEPIVDDCLNLKPEWRDLLIRYANRLMFATDAHKAKRWAKYSEIIQRWRVILGQLPPDISAAIAHKNAERLYKVPTGTD